MLAAGAAVALAAEEVVAPEWVAEWEVAWEASEWAAAVSRRRPVEVALMVACRAVVWMGAVDSTVAVAILAETASGVATLAETEQAQETSVETESGARAISVETGDLEIVHPLVSSTTS
jgi:hypothetical protein